MSQSLFTNGRNVNVAKAYSASFGDLPEGTVYKDPLGKRTGTPFDHRYTLAKQLEPVYRAIDERMEDGETFRSASSEVAKSFLGTDDLTLPVFPREELVNLGWRRTPFVEALPRMTAETKTVDQDSVTSVAEAEFGGEAEVPDDAAEDEYEPQTLSMAYWRIRGSVSGPVQLASATLRNTQAEDQDLKAMGMNQFAENAVLNADPNSGITDGSIEDERGFKGIRPLLEEYEQTRDPEDGEGSSITIEEVRENARLAAEDGGDRQALLHVTDLKTLTDLLNATDDYDPLQIAAEAGSTLEIGGDGVTIDGMDFIVSDFMPNDDGERELLTVDMRYVGMHNLSDKVMESLGKTRDSDDYFMKEYGVFELSAGAHNYCYKLESLA